MMYIVNTPAMGIPPLVLALYFLYSAPVIFAIIWAPIILMRKLQNKPQNKVINKIWLVAFAFLLWLIFIFIYFIFGVVMYPDSHKYFL